MSKRYRIPVAKPDQQIVRYGKPDQWSSPDLVYAWGEGGLGMRATSRCIMAAFESADVLDGKTLRAILTERGYDLTTLKFSIQKHLTTTD